MNAHQERQPENHLPEALAKSIEEIKFGILANQLFEIQEIAIRQFSERGTVLPHFPKVSSHEMRWGFDDWETSMQGAGLIIAEWAAKAQDSKNLGISPADRALDSFLLLQLYAEYRAIRKLERPDLENRWLAEKSDTERLALSVVAGFTSLTGSKLIEFIQRGISRLNQPATLSENE